MKCLNAVSPSPPTPHTMYCSSLSGSRGKSQLSAVNKIIRSDKQWRCQRGRGEVRERGREKETKRGRE